MEEAWLDGVQLALVPHQGTHLVFGHGGMLHEAELVDHRLGVVDPVEVGHHLGEDLEGLQIAALCGSLVQDPPRIQKDLLEPVVPVMLGLLLVAQEPDDLGPAKHLGRGLARQEETLEYLPCAAKVVALLPVGNRGGGHEAVEGVEEAPGQVVAQGQVAEGVEAGQGAGVGARGEDGEEDVLVLVHHLPVLGVLVQDVDGDALALVLLNPEFLAEGVGEAFLLVAPFAGPPVILADELVELLVRPVGQTEEEEGGLGFGELLEDLADELAVGALAWGVATLEHVPEGFQKGFLGAPDRIGPRRLKEKEVVAEGVPIEKEGFVGDEPRDLGREGYPSAVLRGESAEHHEAVLDLLVTQVLERHGGAEHVLRDGAPRAREGDPLAIQPDVHARQEERDAGALIARLHFVEGGREKVLPREVCVVVDLRGDGPVDPDVLEHATPRRSSGHLLDSLL